MSDRNYTLFGFAFIIAVLIFNIVDAALSEVRAQPPSVREGSSERCRFGVVRGLALVRPVVGCTYVARCATHLGSWCTQ